MATTFTDKSPMSLACVFEPFPRTSEDAFMIGDEEPVVDARSGKRPAVMVDDKLTYMLKGDFQMVSQLQLRNLFANRS